MKLSDYIKKNSILLVDFAKLIGISYTALYHYLRGRPPKRNIADRIVAITNNQVTLKDLGYEQTIVYTKSKTD